MNRIRIFHFLVVLTFPFVSFSQAGEWDDADGGYFSEIKPKHAFNAQVRIPLTVQNAAYKKMVKDIVDVGVGYTYHFPFHMTIGVDARMMYNQINATQVEPGLTGGIGTLGVLLKLGYERFITERFGMEASVKFGGVYNAMNTTKNIERLGQGYRNTALVVEPNISFILTASEATSFRLNVGYNIFGYKFSPYDIGSTSLGGFDENQLNKATQIICVGFGFTYYFGQN